MRTVKTKGQQVYDFVLSLIATDHEPGDTLPTETQLAERLGVNRMTIAKVMTRLKEEGYIERKPRRGTIIIRKPDLSPQKRDIVAIILPEYSTSPDHYDLYFSPLLSWLQSFIHQQGLRSLCVTCIDDHDITTDHLTGGLDPTRLRGIISTFTFEAGRDRLTGIIKDLQSPTVWVGAHADTFAKHCIDVDDRQGARDATEHLLNCGYSRIGFISTQINTAAKAQRLQGFKDAFAARSLPFPENNLTIIETHSGLREAGETCAQTIIDNNLDFDALFVCDTMLVQGISSFQKKNPASQQNKLFSLPIATFDADAVSHDRRIICSVEQPVKDLCKQAIDLLQDLFSGRKTGKHQRLLQPKLLIFDQ